MIDKKIQEPIDALFAGYDQPASPGCAVGVIKNGEFVYARGYGLADLSTGKRITSGTVFHLASVSKQFTAACIALLEEAGQLSLDDLAGKYIPFLPPAARDVRIRHLVYMTNGLEDLYDVTSLIMGIPEGQPITKEQAIRIVRAADWLKFPPGERWSYGNSGYFLLACIVEQISGQSFAQFARQHIFEPLGMAHTFVHDPSLAERSARAQGYSRRPDAQGQPVFVPQPELVELAGAGQVWSSINDLALWEKNFFDNRLGGQDSHLIEKMTTSGQLNDGTLTGYAYGQFISRQRGRQVIYHEGGAAGVNSVIYRLPEKKYSVIVLANTSDFLTVHLRKLGEECYERIAGIVWPWEPQPAAETAVPPAPPLTETLTIGDLKALEGPPESPLTLDDLKEYEGNYTCAALATSYAVRAEPDGLRLENILPENDLLNRIFHPGLKDIFVAKDPPVITWYAVHFQRDERARVVAFNFRDEVPGRDRWVFRRE